eukprot:gnl/Chilomastix_cuspidata/3576.p2 GENE.gnl/Chilomastix_cuspidata/3576~~gnl/Chilomastix_cuspidata/3576.p2  ORF type:complete len:103 (+),score=15.36 gnl/Chilomastix_cuspidata/3576:30-311(+)
MRRLVRFQLHAQLCVVPMPSLLDLPIFWIIAVPLMPMLVFPLALWALPHIFAGTPRDITVKGIAAIIACVSCNVPIVAYFLRVRKTSMRAKKD